MAWSDTLAWLLVAGMPYALMNTIRHRLSPVLKAGHAGAATAVAREYTIRVFADHGR